MQRKFMPTEPRHAGTNARPSPRRIRAASPNRGFFTFGFVIAILAASALGVGMVEAVAPESASGPVADVDRLTPVDHAKHEDAKTVAVSEAPAQLAIDSRRAGKVPQ